MNKLRLSWTLLNLWQQGKVDEAVAFYLKLERKETPEMVKGKELHKLNEENLKEARKFIKEFGGLELKKPRVEWKIEMNYNELFDLVGVIDAYDEETKTLYEFKTGKMSAISYLNSHQLGIYSLLLQKENKPVKKIMVIRWDGKKTDWAFKWFYPELIEEAKNFVDSLGPEIYQFFEERGII